MIEIGGLYHDHHQNYYHHLIQGAGAAGIGASSALYELGIDFIMLEGRKKIGGRVRSHKMLDGTRVEIGANW